MMRSFNSLRRRVGGLSLAMWFATMVALGSGLLAKHVVALPEPSSPRLAPALNALRNPAQEHRWLAVHVLYSDCRCSQRVADHLASTARPADWSEMILWVGDEAPAASLTQNFDVRHVTARDLASDGIEAAPSLVVLDETGAIRYSGGYTDRKQGPAIEDLHILAALKQGQPIKAYPLFGCAVSSRLKSELAVLPTP